MGALSSSKRILLVLFVSNLLSFTASSQVFVCTEIGNKTNLNKGIYYAPQISYYTEYFKKDSKIGFYNFALFTETWGQAYAGIIIKPGQWLALSLGVGLETAENPYRYNITLQSIKNRINFLQIYEYGGSGLWYNILLNYELNKQNYLGLISKRYYGIGLHYEQRFKEIPLGLIFFPSFDFEDKNYKFTVLVRYYISK